MTNSSREKIRPEAQTISDWDRLTKDQQDGLARLLGLLSQAKNNLNVVRHEDPRLPWLARSNYSQVAFIHGMRHGDCAILGNLR
ncbi:MAG: hypothetical protein GY768_16945 [Planctomycetaceae bacterium]|nr:hypothetical protein [Planctomycetaceae bacterium]